MFPLCPQYVSLLLLHVWSFEPSFVPYSLSAWHLCYILFTSVFNELVWGYLFIIYWPFWGLNLGRMHHRQMLYHRTTVLAVAFGFWKWGLGPCCPVAQTSPTPSLLNNWTMVVQHSDLLATFLINKSMSKTWEKVEQSLGRWAVHAWTLEYEGRVIVDASFICLLLPSTGSHCLFSSQVREVVGRGPVFQGYNLAPGSYSLLSAPVSWAAWPCLPHLDDSETMNQTKPFLPCFCPKVN